MHSAALHRPKGFQWRGPGDGLFLGRYRIAAPIAAGAAGAVYVAVDERTEDHVVVKIFDAGERINGWVEEMRLAMRLRHDRIVRCLDVGLDRATDLNVLVFEWARGGSLRRALAERRGRPFPPFTVRRILHGLATGLGYAHSLGIIHRDIKPENVVDADGTGRWQITDFGAGRFLVAGAVAETLTGSLSYLAPEIYAGRGVAASDQYSLGVVGLELLSGHIPTPEERTEFVLANRGCPGLRGVVATLCEGDPQRRFPSMASAVAALDTPDCRVLTTVADDGPVALVDSHVHRGAGAPLRVMRPLWFLNGPGQLPIVACDRRIVEIGSDRVRTLYVQDRSMRALAVDRVHGLAVVADEQVVRLVSLSGGSTVAEGTIPSDLSRAERPLGRFLSSAAVVCARAGHPAAWVLRREGAALKTTALATDGPVVDIATGNGTVAIACSREHGSAVLVRDDRRLVRRRSYEVGADQLRFDASAGTFAPVVETRSNP